MRAPRNSLEAIWATARPKPSPLPFLKKSALVKGSDLELVGGDLPFPYGKLGSFSKSPG